jgi:cell filamentation protein, protein adenylyltransferase
MPKPPFSISSKVLNLNSQILELIGELKSLALVKPPLKLRKENKIKTIHHSLAIEGNSLTEEQVSTLLEKKRVLGPKNQILEVVNALEVYDIFPKLDASKEKDLLKAHGLLMKGLVKTVGKYRSTAVGILKGTKVSHMAPPAKRVGELMTDLFGFLNTDKETPWLIKACVFHYELEFIHPFEDGNGRMGRLWQQLLLMKQSPIFEFVSVETLIHKKQKEYYKTLEHCDASGDSTAFVEFSLELILESLREFQQEMPSAKPRSPDRMDYALEHFGGREFTRKEYLQLHKALSTATASRDLAEAVADGILKKTGDKALARYRRG